MPEYRKKLTFETIGGQRGIILQCNKSEKKSVVKRHLQDGQFKWMSESVTSKHPDGSPKHLHVKIQEEGIYQIFGQPTLSGFYCFYKALNGLIYYAPISEGQVKALLAAAPLDFRQALIGMNVTVF